MQGCLGLLRCGRIMGVYFGLPGLINSPEFGGYLVHLIFFGYLTRRPPETPPFSVRSNRHILTALIVCDCYTGF